MEQSRRRTSTSTSTCLVSDDDDDDDHGDGSWASRLLLQQLFSTLMRHAGPAHLQSSSSSSSQRRVSARLNENRHVGWLWVVSPFSILSLSLSLSLSLFLLLLLKRTSFLPSPFASHHPTWVQQSAHFPCALFPPCTVALDRQLISRLISASSVFCKIPHRVSPSMDHHDDDDEFPVSKKRYRFTWPSRVQVPVSRSWPAICTPTSRLGKREQARFCKKSKTKKKKKKDQTGNAICPHPIPSHPARSATTEGSPRATTTTTTTKEKIGNETKRKGKSLLARCSWFAPLM
ncbi:hypothetical protein IWZ00DRAFT_323626 [Phyllosticta capitalensis]